MFPVSYEWWAVERIEASVVHRGLRSTKTTNEDKTGVVIRKPRPAMPLSMRRGSESETSVEEKEGKDQK